MTLTVHLITNLRLPIVCLAALLGGCSAAPPPAPPPAPHPVEQIRASAIADPGVLTVLPLTPPEVMLLLDQARKAEMAGQVEKARTFISRAMEITPQDPELWQYLAELALRQGEFQVAAEHARHAFDIGPQVGPICYRNWLTMGLAQAELGLQIEAAQAGRRADLCAIRAAPRY